MGRPETAAESGNKFTLGPSLYKGCKMANAMPLSVLFSWCGMHSELLFQVLLPFA